MEECWWLVSDCEEKADIIGRLSAGFDWASQPHSPQWVYEMINLLEMFSVLHLQLIVKKLWKENINLGLWLIKDKK